MATVDTLPAETKLIIGADNDKVLAITPTRDGVAVDRTSKQLRFVIKAEEDTADASALVDINSVDDTADVYGVGAAATGEWAVDLSGLLPAAGEYWYRADLTASSGLDTDRECYARGILVVKAV